MTVGEKEAGARREEGGGREFGEVTGEREVGGV